LWNPLLFVRFCEPAPNFGTTAPLLELSAFRLQLQAWAKFLVYSSARRTAGLSVFGAARWREPAFGLAAHFCSQMLSQLAANCNSLDRPVDKSWGVFLRALSTRSLIGCKQNSTDFCEHFWKINRRRRIIESRNISAQCNSLFAHFVFLRTHHSSHVNLSTSGRRVVFRSLWNR